ncbi:hypothetical protein [Raoultella ornithinolytica]|uniref:hypothetical protein n=2 Tax=Raoultella TaxID=160674 RepID=UPI00096A8399
MKAFAFCIAALMSSCALANGYTAYCGPYTIVAKVGEMDMINGERVTSQKITNLGSDGIRIDMGLMPARDGNNYGFQYIHRPGSEKRFLNVQLLQNSMDAPKIIGSFPCKKVSS